MLFLTAPALSQDADYENKSGANDISYICENKTGAAQSVLQMSCHKQSSLHLFLSFMRRDARRRESQAQEKRGKKQRRFDFWPPRKITFHRQHASARPLFLQSSLTRKVLLIISFSLFISSFAAPCLYASHLFY
jgi:hypothetical protein